MKHRGQQIRSLLLMLLLVGAAPRLSAQAPEVVSPGAVDRVAQVEGRCPTFFWGAVPEAAAYELVVYRLPDDSGSSGRVPLDLTEDDQVLYAELPAGATAWQPEFARALEPGLDYVWFIRAVFWAEGNEVAESGDWSAARFFSIATMPSPQEVEEALSVLRRYGGHQESRSSGLEGSWSDHRIGGTGGAGAGPQSLRSPAALKSIPTAFAAIRGAQADTTGESYGVVGISSSPEGAGLGAANTAGGPDLVLDGSEDLLADAKVSQSGIDRPSGSAQTFDISNTGGGGMMLTVEGVEVTTTESDLDADKLTSGTLPDDRLAGSYSQPLTLSNSANQFTGSGVGLTGVDADTLDGVEGSAFATDAEAAALVAAHAVSAAHDGRYYTKTQLNTSGAGGAVHWGNLTAVPAGFADGIDNEASFTAGPGIIIDNGEVRIDAAAFSTRLSTVDELGDVGSHSSMAIGADGLGLISYFSGSFHSLKVAHCIDVVCSEAVTSTLDDYGASGVNSAIAIGADGLGIISFYEGLQDDLKVAHCNDLACSSATITTLDSTGNVGSGPSITIGADGLPLISYYNATAENLKIAHCNDVACSSATTPTLDSGGDVGQHSAIAIGADGLGLISYFDDTNNQIKIAHCTNVACSSADLAVLVSAGDVGSETSIAIGADGLGLISYFDNSTGEIRVAHCRNAACTTAHIAIIDTVPGVGEHISLAIGADGFGLVSYIDQANFDLKLARCVDTDCSSATTTVIDGEVKHNGDTSIAIGVDGLGLVSYQDSADDLGIAHLGIGVP